MVSCSKITDLRPGLYFKLLPNSTFSENVIGELAKYFDEDPYLPKIPKNPICEKVDISETGRKVSASIIWNSLRRNSIIIARLKTGETAKTKQENDQFVLFSKNNGYESDDSFNESVASSDDEEYGEKAPYLKDGYDPLLGRSISSSKETDELSFEEFFEVHIFLTARRSRGP